MTLVEKWREVCKLNESGPTRWYKLANAGMAACGLSFGINQFDLHTRDDASTVLGRVLGAAKAADPGLAITAAQIAGIEKGALSELAKDIVPGTAAHALIGPVDEALATDAGKAALMAESESSLQTDVTGLATWASRLNDKLGSEALLEESLLGQLLLLDFFNLFGPPTTLTDYLRGVGVALGGGVPAPVVAPTAVSDLVGYILTTEQGSGPAKDQQAEVLRRLNNVFKVARPSRGWPNWSAKDQAWFAQHLSRIVNEPKTGPVADLRKAGAYADLPV